MFLGTSKGRVMQLRRRPLYWPPGAPHPLPPLSPEKIKKGSYFVTLHRKLVLSCFLWKVKFSLNLQFLQICTFPVGADLRGGTGTTISESVNPTLLHLTHYLANSKLFCIEDVCGQFWHAFYISAMSICMLPFQWWLCSIDMHSMPANQMLMPYKDSKQSLPTKVFLGKRWLHKRPQRRADLLSWCHGATVSSTEAPITDAGHIAQTRQLKRWIRHDFGKGKSCNIGGLTSGECSPQTHY